MIKRYYITLGALTTAGGKVTTASSFMSIDGVRVALERDSVWCAQCNAEGVIALDGSRMASSCNGRQYALSDDLCICQCSPPPRLMAAQDHSSQSIDADWLEAQVDTLTATAGQLNEAVKRAAGPDSMALLLLDVETQQPYRQRRYRLELRDKVIEGTTDQNGATEPLTPAERAAVLTWQLGPAAAS